MLSPSKSFLVPHSVQVRPLVAQAELPVALDALANSYQVPAVWNVSEKFKFKKFPLGAVDQEFTWQIPFELAPVHEPPCGWCPTQAPFPAELSRYRVFVLATYSRWQLLVRTLSVDDVLRNGCTYVIADEPL